MAARTQYSVENLWTIAFATENQLHVLKLANGVSASPKVVWVFLDVVQSELQHRVLRRTTGPPLSIAGPCPCTAALRMLGDQWQPNHSSRKCSSRARAPTILI
ncbi:hypothetical protein EAH_00026400 [Eimeria acervulina]|uniref:Uncharacterized protein n=1 Tax=Eimeria acervulina TaxID=5801 RepID=U6GBQ3_EIMAC|nr:hypothetical protein EAH_00026400 [Eimeria acervulina]CDI77696.1 hypothetical protein EAH_00026400 [Eimeria acervulina]